MKRNKSSISEADSYKKIADFWDIHDLTDYWSQTKDVSFDVEIESETNLYAVEKSLSNRVQVLAKKKGITANRLINMWIREKLQFSKEN